ncbi:MAG: T9SS type A sorting domain-containing protein [Marinilabiliaceae bacterium]|nr:T9SS type A sorting domain-containing protein [Marinilabiliaceae bacterium]
MYKILIIIAVMIICNIDLAGQQLPSTSSINYTYDNAGNRVSRVYTISIVKPKTAEVEIETEIETEIEIEGEGKEEEETLLLIEDSKIEVYPNPVKDELFVEIMNGDNKETYRLVIFDSTGKMVNDTKRQGNGKEPIDMSMFPSGVYYLIISTKEGKLEFKIVVSG